MSNSRRRYWPLFCFLIAVLGGCGGWQPSESTVLPDTMTPKAGGMILPTAQPALPADGLLSQTQTIAILQPGQLVIAVNPEGLTLQADASTSAASMEHYRPGTAFTVLEPNGDYATYPVQQDSHTWYRFQASDGLVGWAMIEAIVTAPNFPAPTATPAG